MSKWIAARSANSRINPEAYLGIKRAKAKTVPPKINPIEGFTSRNCIKNWHLSCNSLRCSCNCHNKDN